MLIEIIHDIVNKQPRGIQIPRGSEDEKCLVAELEKLLADRKLALDALKHLFPEGITESPVFHERLGDLHLRLGWTETSHRLTGLFLLLAVEQLPESSGEALLNGISQIGNPHFFQALYRLNILLAEIKLRPEFAASWFPDLVRRIGNDLASGGFWNALGIYCERQTNHALEALRILATGGGEEQISVAAYLLGTIRCLDLTGETSQACKKLEAEISADSNIGTRAIYHRSWIQTAWRGKMQKEDLNLLLNRLNQGTPEEKEQSVWIVCRSLLSPSISTDSFDFGLSWLRANLSGTISPTAKYNVVDFAAKLPAVHRKEAAELVLLIQPILAKHKGTWVQLEYFLVPWLETDLPGFSDFCFKLANANARNWTAILKAPKSFEWFLTELHGKDIGDLVGKLVLSQSAGCRKLGLFLFDELGMSTLPTTMLETVGVGRVKLAFYELQRNLVHGHALARYLIMLIPCVERTDEAFQEEFFEELVRQLKNYGGSCRKEFESKADNIPLLKKALKTADVYFDALHKVRKSGVNAMEVTGYRKAAHMHARKMSNAISKGAKEMSVFMQFCKTVRLLYGKTWSSFYDGKLGETSGLKQFSSSFEVPRLEIIDPEGMALLRLYASSKILEIGKSGQVQEEEE